MKANPMRVSNWRSSLVVFVFAGLGVVYLLLAVGWQYIASDFLYGRDDFNFIMKALDGQAISLAGYEVFYVFIRALAPIESIALFKVALLVLLGICAGGLALLLNATHSPIQAILIALLVVTIPLDATQLIFISGSHSILVLTLVLAAMIVFQSAAPDKRLVFGGRSIFVIGLLLIAAKTSPIGQLAPLAFPLWQFNLWLHLPKACRKQHRRFMGATTLVLSVIAAVVYAAFIYTPHHYSGLQGFTQLSGGQIAKNLWLALKQVQESLLPIAPLGYLAAFAWLLLLVCWLVEGIRSRTNGIWTRHYRILGFNALIMAALTFGPASVVTALVDRYLTLPTTLAIFAVLAWAYPAQTNSRGILTWVMNLALFTLVFSQVATLGQLWEREFRNLYVAQSHLKTLIETQTPAWETNAQVVLLQDENFDLHTDGYNHWSTGYLRYLTGNDQIYGLIGAVDAANRDPFVANGVDPIAQALSQDIFWETQNGRKKRIAMYGLTINRPLYVYRQDAAGSYHQIETAIITHDGVTRFVDGGESFEESVSEPNVTCRINTQATHLWLWNVGVMPQIPESAAIGQTGSYTFTGTQQDMLTLTADPFNKFSLIFYIAPATTPLDEQYTATTPPMPLLSSVIAVYQLPNRLRITDRLHDTRIFNVQTEGDITQLTLSGVEGCYMLIGADNMLIGAMNNLSIQGDWLLGRGFRDRYWSGNINTHIHITR